MLDSTKRVSCYPLPRDFLEHRLTVFPETMRVVIDTDPGNEIDDQFAILWALLSPKLKVEAIHAAPFSNSRSSYNPALGAERSYDEICNLLKLVHADPQGIAFPGATSFLQSCESPFETPATNNLLERAFASNEPLYVVTIGAPTNVASAIIRKPAIAERIVVIWLGGQPLSCDSAKEFNLQQDVIASKVLFDSGVPLVLVPCRHVAELLLTTTPEIEKWLKDESVAANYLCNIFTAFSNDHFAWSRSIWDISTVAWLLDQSWFTSTIVESPTFDEEFQWVREPSRHVIRVVTHLKRDPIFRDMFLKLCHAV